MLSLLNFFIKFFLGFEIFFFLNIIVNKFLINSIKNIYKMFNILNNNYNSKINIYKNNNFFFKNYKSFN